MTIRKTITATVAALTLVAALAASSGHANAKPWGKWGPGFGVGLAVGMIGAAAIAGSAYASYCERVPMYDVYGNYIGSRRVCY